MSLEFRVHACDHSCVPKRHTCAGLAMFKGFDEVVNPSETDSHSSVDGGQPSRRLARQEEEEALAEFARQYESCSVREIRQDTSDTEKQISALTEQIRHLRNKSVYLAKLLEDKVITATVTTVSGERRELSARLGEMVADAGLLLKNLV